MSGINKVILVGHLGEDPEIRYLTNTIAVARFQLGTTEIFNKDGRKTEKTEWHNIVMWHSLADMAVKILRKGNLIYLEGKLRTWIVEEKQGQKEAITEVVAESFKLLGRKSDFEEMDEPQISTGKPSNLHVI